jgi:hypothetical protein
MSGLKNLRPGNNLEVLTNARRHFEKQGIGIVDYHFSFNIGERLDSNDLYCCVCDKELFREEHGQFFSVRTLVFLDDQGESHFTCYKLNGCFKRVSPNKKFSRSGKSFKKTPKALSKKDGSMLEDIVKTHVPNYYEFLGIDSESIDTKSFANNRAVTSYNKNVKPFIVKWAARTISKECLVEFLVEWNAVADYAIVNFEDEASAKAALEKIQRLIGVLK